MTRLRADALHGEVTTVRGFRQIFTHEGRGGTPLLLIHGWPETRRIWSRNIASLATAGFEVIAPDLRGHGDSDLGPDGLHDVPNHSRDLHALVSDLGHRSVIAAGGDLGGVVIQDLSARFPGFVDRAVIFNTRLPWDREVMKGLSTLPPREVSDYFYRQAYEADIVADELGTDEQRRRYIATFYTSRLWSHPGSFGDEDVAFMTEPFADARRLRAGFGFYESLVSQADGARALAPLPNDTPALLLFGASDPLMYPDFDRMAARVFPQHVGPFLLRDCGHFVQWEAASQFNSAVTAWCL